ncbi:tripartite tricarboxylate transporter TctB family protein [Halobacillus shinanisalinarum]|uniref:Tripartite tricarboxylate transporter TctB family protein n=1 Tax=Halobacillus shinanisalinarum TaxID=2932258 RepID=A0ABY4GUT1_9BACI|nr:tripartite tricarboxylate transporter TctB family protein [Halobacillus shinanisalinarum]UOQ91903.1 tripartite tricarboxylate transporter TctB family protein [Halobacillus shinanisalinarum]
MQKSNYIFAIIMAILALLFYFWGNAFSEEASQWPQFFAITLLLLSILLVVDTFLKPNREKDEDEDEVAKPQIYEKKVFYSALLLIVYLLIMDKLGFLLTTPIFLAALLWAINYRFITKLVTISLGTTIALTIIFQFLLGVPIPQGVLANLF